MQTGVIAMTDIPVFTAANGIATLILHEIPARKEGYILVRAVFGSLAGLLRECADFCRGAGAERVYAGGEADFSAYPVFARLMERRLTLHSLPPVGCAVEPLTQETAPRWAELYNARFSGVPSAQSCGPYETKRLTQSGEAFFVLEEGERIGLGRVRGGTLLALASLRPGAGERTLFALARHCGLHEITLTCAVENARAMAFYDRLGFTRGPVRQVWYTVG